MPSILLNDPVVSAWLEQLWRASWQGGLALLLAWGVTRAWAGMPPGVRVWLWRLACLKLLAAFLWTGAVPLRVTPERAAAVLAPLAVLQPAADNIPAVESAPAQSDIPPVSPATDQTGPITAPSPSWRLTASAMLSGLGALWAFGVILGALRLLLAWRRTHRLRRGCRTVQEAEVLAIFQDCVDRAGLRRAPALLARLTGTPLLLGIVRPAIIVPEALLAPEARATLRLVLFHELAHLKRRDLLWGWLPALCGVLFFFHPLVWLAAREHRLAQEIACDALTLRLAGAEQAVYGRMLMETILQRRSLQPAPLTLGIAESFVTIHRRLSAMTHFTPRLSRIHLAVSAVLLAPLLLALVPWQLAAQEENRPHILLQVGHTGAPTSLAITPDGRTLVSASGSDIISWNLATGLITDRYHPTGERAITFRVDPTGRYLATMRFDAPSVEIHDLQMGKLVHALPKARQSVAGFSRRGPWYWTLDGGEGGLQNLLHGRHTLTQRNLTDGAARRTIPGLFGLVMAISLDETKAITLTGTLAYDRGRLLDLEDAAFIVWDLATGTEARHIPCPISLSPATALSPDGCLFAASPRNREGPDDIAVWEVATGKRVALLTGHQAPVPALAFSPDGQWLASGGEDGRTILWDTGNWGRTKTFDREQEGFNTLTFSPDGRFLAIGNAQKAAGEQGSIQLWDIDAGEVAQSLAGKVAVPKITGLALSSDGRWLAMGAEGQVGLWDVTEGRMARELPIPVETARPSALAFSPDGAVLAAGLANERGGEGQGHLLVWRTADGTLLHDLPAHMSTILQVTFSPDSASAATGAMDGMVILWNTKDWTPVRRITAAGRVGTAAFSSDGARLFWTAQLGGGDLLQWLDIATGVFGEAAAEENHTYLDLSTSPDGRLLLLRALVRNPDTPALYKCLLHDAQTGRPMRELTSITRDIQSLSVLDPLGFSPDGRRVLGIDTLYSDLIQWDAATGTVIRTARLPVTTELPSITRDGARLATLNVFEGTVKLWDVGQFLADAHVPAELATLRWFDQARWLITTPHGDFDCDPALEKAIAWRKDGEVFPFEQFAGEYHRPEKIREALAGR